MRRAALGITLLGLLLSGACRLPRSYTREGSSDVGDAGSSSGNLGPGDILEVRVYQEVDLSGVYRVAPEGVISFPLCGKVKVVGMTALGAADALTECLKAGFIRRPQVVVLVKEFNSKKVFVFGDVSKPGALPFEVDMTIIHAISSAGGFNRTAAKNSVNITRTVSGQEVKIPVKVEDMIQGREKNVAVLPGDIIFVPEGFL
jgi:protein involved in polysaccharide export with SLBB domain